MKINKAYQLSIILIFSTCLTRLEVCDHSLANSALSSGLARLYDVSISTETLLTTYSSLYESLTGTRKVFSTYIDAIVACSNYPLSIKSKEELTKENDAWYSDLVTYNNKLSIPHKDCQVFQADFNNLFVRADELTRQGILRFIKDTEKSIPGQVHSGQNQLLTMHSSFIANSRTRQNYNLCPNIKQFDENAILKLKEAEKNSRAWSNVLFEHKYLINKSEFTATVLIYRALSYVESKVWTQTKDMPELIRAKELLGLWFRLANTTDERTETITEAKKLLQFLLNDLDSTENNSIIIYQANQTMNSSQYAYIFIQLIQELALDIAEFGFLDEAFGILQEFLAGKFQVSTSLSYASNFEKLFNEILGKNDAILEFMDEGMASFYTKLAMANYYAHNLKFTFSTNERIQLITNIGELLNTNFKIWPIMKDMLVLLDNGSLVSYVIDLIAFDNMFYHLCFFLKENINGVGIENWASKFDDFLVEVYQQSNLKKTSFIPIMRMILFFRKTDKFSFFSLGVLEKETLEFIAVKLQEPAFGSLLWNLESAYRTSIINQLNSYSKNFEQQQNNYNGDQKSHEERGVLIKTLNTLTTAQNKAQLVIDWLATGALIYSTDFQTTKRNIRI